MKAASAAFALASAVLFLPLPACQSSSPQVGSQTNWLRACELSDVCGEFACVCGTCTISCDDQSDCDEQGLGSCVPAEDPGATASCQGQSSGTGMCLPRCDEEPCPGESSCLAGVCVASVDPSTSVTIDASLRYQSLIGFGASLGLDENFIVDHPQKEEIYDAMFGGSGFEFVRLRNRFNGDNAVDFGPAVEILAAAEERLGKRPTIFMTSGSPPPSLKANGVSFCVNSDPDCTLIRDETGAFDYAGYAEYWRASLEAYAAVGIVPDFVSMQNNPDWLPPGEGSVEACRFLPEEGIGVVEASDGTTLEAPFPGYQEALAAVLTAVQTLPDAYNFSGPETSDVTKFDEYSGVLEGVSSLSFHLYETDPLGVSWAELDALRALGEERGQPIIQSEMLANGLDTALLTHHALVDGGSSGYLQLGFVVATDDEEFGTLIGADDSSFTRFPPYYALSHFARFTGQGWTRVEIQGEPVEVLSSAWLSPDGGSLTLVLVNGGDDLVNVEVVLPEEYAPFLEDTSVIRTVFGGVERMADLGGLPNDAVVRIPGGSVVTISTRSGE